MIVLVEDNPDQRLVLRLALEQAGYPVREAASGRDALALLLARPSPFVITDIFMPDIDGLELAGAIMRELPGTKIIVMSGGSGRVGSTDYLTAARLIGVAATLEKPFRMEALLDALARLRETP